MAKYNVVLDTNIYRKNPSRTDLQFQALERLCRAGILELHVPYIVEREFQTQQSTLYKKDLDNALSSISALLRRGVADNQIANLQSIRDNLSAAAQPLLNEVESNFVDWAKSLNAVRHPITEEIASAAMEAYFKGQSPLTNLKNREDIPDSFIYQTILKLQGKKPLIVVAEDGKIFNSVQAIDNTTAYKSLSEFIESEIIQTEILELDVIDNLTTIAQVLEEFETDSADIASLIFNQAGNKLTWKHIRSDLIHDDNKEAIITGYHHPENIELYFDELYYSGDGEFGLPFSFSTFVDATFYVFKADYFTMDMENASMSVSDHNDHYFEAEDEFEISVEGFIKVSMNTEYLKSISIDTLSTQLKLEIDSIDEIEVLR